MIQLLMEKLCAYLIGIIMLAQAICSSRALYIHVYSNRGHSYSRMKSEATPIPVLVNDQSYIQHQIAQIKRLPGAHAHNTHLRVLLLHLSQQGSRLSRTRRTNWVAQGNRTAVGVNLGHVQAQLANTVDALAGEGLVKFEDTHVALLNATVFVEVADGEDGRDTHLVGAVTGHLRTGEPRNGLQTVGVSPCPAGEDGCRGTVRDLGPTLVSYLSTLRQPWNFFAVRTSYRRCCNRSPEQL